MQYKIGSPVKQCFGYMPHKKIPLYCFLCECWRKLVTDSLPTRQSSQPPPTRHTPLFTTYHCKKPIVAESSTLYCKMPGHKPILCGLHTRWINDRRESWQDAMVLNEFASWVKEHAIKSSIFWWRYRSIKTQFNNYKVADEWLNGTSYDGRICSTCSRCSIEKASLYQEGKTKKNMSMKLFQVSQGFPTLRIQTEHSCNNIIINPSHIHLYNSQQILKSWIY